MLVWLNWFMAWFIVGLIYFAHRDAEEIEKRRKLQKLSQDVINRFTTEDSPTLTEMINYHKDNEPTNYKID